MIRNHFLSLDKQILLLLLTPQLVMASPESKPFAEERIVLQISDATPFMQPLVLQ